MQYSLKSTENVIVVTYHHNGYHGNSVYTLH